MAVTDVTVASVTVPGVIVTGVASPALIVAVIVRHYRGVGWRRRAWAR
jgi:hypothetical protein